MRRVAAACLVGSAIEFYDFLIYGTAPAQSPDRPGRRKHPGRYAHADLGYSLNVIWTYR